MRRSPLCLSPSKFSGAAPIAVQSTELRQASTRRSQVSLGRPNGSLSALPQIPRNITADSGSWAETLVENIQAAGEEGSPTSAKFANPSRFVLHQETFGVFVSFRRSGFTVQTDKSVMSGCRQKPAPSQPIGWVTRLHAPRAASERFGLDNTGRAGQKTIFGFT